MLFLPTEKYDLDQLGPRLEPPNDSEIQNRFPLPANTSLRLFCLLSIPDIQLFSSETKRSPQSRQHKFSNTTQQYISYCYNLVIL